jgi:hypothetical protein
MKKKHNPSQSPLNLRGGENREGSIILFIRVDILQPSVFSLNTHLLTFFYLDYQLYLD